jgi:hypothetical protein
MFFLFRKYQGTGNELSPGEGQMDYKKKGKDTKPS